MYRPECVINSCGWAIPYIERKRCGHPEIGNDDFRCGNLSVGWYEGIITVWCEVEIRHAKSYRE